MARLVTKFKYLKPNRSVSAGGYVKYIATREGVDKIDDTKKLAPATVSQKKLIEKILKDFPDSKDMFEYTDYLKKQNVGTASEFISRAIEDNAYEIAGRKTYAKYIATRPRSERFGSHGLFTDDGVQVQLGKITEELDRHKGNIWTAIISIRREDAERLGFNTGTRWRDMLRTQTEALSKNLKIPMGNLKWYAAFHNESHHPHVHLIAYSTVENEGYLTKNGVENLRSSFAKDIFQQDLLCIYEKQTEHRNELRNNSRKVISEVVSQINSDVYENPLVEELLLKLSDRLSKTGGKKVYGYLKPDVKAIVNSIVEELAKDERISKLYDLWYEQRENILRTYTDEMPKRIPLVDNKEFKSIKNSVIQEALNINLNRITDEVENDEDDTEEIKIEEPNYNPFVYEIEAEEGNAKAQYFFGKDLLYGIESEQDVELGTELLMKSAEKGNKFAKFLLAKEYLSGNIIPQNILKALKMLTELADNHFNGAEYLLGKLYYRGEFVPKDISKALYYLESCAENGNTFAAYLAGKIYLNEESCKDINKAIYFFDLAADSGNPYAEYQLGKLYLYSVEVEKDFDFAVEYLISSSKHGNQYAEQLLNSIKNNRNYFVAMGSLRLLQHLSSIIQNRLDNEHKHKLVYIDRKLQQKIDDKKQAQGLH